MGAGASTWESFFSRDICGGAELPVHRASISPRGAGEMAFPAAGRLPGNGALHNLVTKESLRVWASLGAFPARLPPARQGLRGDNILSKTLFLILPLTLAQIRLRAAQISSGKPLKRFKMSFSQFEGFCLANPVQGRLQASRPLLCCWCSSRSR